MNNQSVLIKLLAISIGYRKCASISITVWVLKEKGKKEKVFYGSISFVMSDLRGNQAS